MGRRAEKISREGALVERFRLPMVPTLELVDLPGIQAFPEDQCKMTTDLVSEYLTEKETLVLCAVDATIPAFDGSLALQMLRDTGKLSQTIIALTKSDLVTDEKAIVEQIFERVLRQSSDLEHLEGIVGCVAVANRDDRDLMTLVESDAAERRVFADMLREPAPAYEPAGVQEKLRNTHTKQQLLSQLDVMFHNHIVQHWKPRALNKLKQLASQAELDLWMLGTPVAELRKDAVMEAVLSQVGHHCMAPDLSYGLTM